MKAWWNSLQLRERQLLLTGACLMAALAYWLLLWQPLVAAREQSRAAVASLQQATAQARTEVTAILASRTLAAPRPVRSLFALIDSSARDAGLMSAQTRIEPLGEDRVRVSMDGVSFDQLAAWLENLDRSEGVDISEWSVDRALVPGVVNASMTLQTSR
ncbi:MAG TPA: type II secretion system protein GspM [Xanthomonadales bacterium]|nr:type II secretion system protein GspM [Xanthomonadales bacterium]